MRLRSDMNKNAMCRTDMAFFIVAARATPFATEF
jgi:hypothetical protein